MRSVEFSQWIAVVMDRIAHGWDAVILIDGNDANPLGPVGLAKSRLGLIIDRVLDPWWDITEDFVPVDDVGVFRKIAYNPHPKPYQVVHVDEAHWFVYNEYHAFKDVRALTPAFMSNRKEHRSWLFLTNTIWKTIEFLRESRIQWRVRLERRDPETGDAEFTLWERGGPASVVPKKDLWGTLVGRVVGIPEVPDRVWNEYEAAVADHNAYHPSVKLCALALRG